MTRFGLFLRLVVIAVCGFGAIIGIAHLVTFEMFGFFFLAVLFMSLLIAANYGALYQIEQDEKRNTRR